MVEYLLCDRFSGGRRGGSWEAATERSRYQVKPEV